VARGAGEGDSDVPPAPLFGLSLLVGQPGTVELSGVGFQDLTNTRTATAGSLTIYYWNELGATERFFRLANAVGAEDTVIDLNVPGGEEAGGIIQIESEILRVEGTLNGGTQYQVTRGLHTTTAIGTQR